MAPITALAKETLQLLFSHINSTKQLAQCRLVCKRFNPIAEKAMFDCSVVINIENQAFSLLQHLVRCQRKGISHFHWDFETTMLKMPQVFKHLLTFILTSKTVSLTGCIQGDKLYDLIDGIVQQLPEKPSLILLPHPVEFREHYYRFLAKYQNTLQSAYILYI